jgi:NAD+ synthase
MPDWKEIESIIKRFIADKVEETGADGVVLGLSGGLDSALTAKICADTLGKDRVHALLMPEIADKNDEDFRDALDYAKELGINHNVFEISSVVREFSSIAGKISKNALANVKARVRMTILYAYAYDRNLIVMGTSNKSELLTGYFTKFGDGGADFMPLGDLYKTEIREFASYMGVPERFISKAPSARLYPNQTDEGELGIDYDTLDCILKDIEKDMDDDGISKDCGTSLNEVERIRKMVRESAHKRKTPLIPKIGLRTVGWDWRE